MVRAICDLLKIFKSGVFAVLPENLIQKYVNYSEVTQKLIICGEQFDLKNKNCYMVGAGKAVQNMALEVEKILGSKIKMGIISIPEGSLSNKSINDNMMFCEGAKNNLPDVNAVTTTKKINNLAKSLNVNDFLLVLISGGGSSLLSLPKYPISLDEKINIIKKLANSGADIKELNTVRKRLSDIKNGHLAINAYPATIVTLVISDVIGDPLDVIACGPTVKDNIDSSKTLAILRKFKLQNDLPESIQLVLQKQFETDKTFPVKNVHNFVIGSNKLSIDNAFVESQSLKYFSIILSYSVSGNVKHVAGEYLKLIQTFCDYLRGNLDQNNLKQKLQAFKVLGINSNVLNNLDTTAIGTNDLCLILGGEITVEVKGPGKGGRNQQLALECSHLMHKAKDDLNHFDVYFLSAGTDGIDGPTDAAGGIGYLDLINDAEKEGLDVNLYIENNDSYNFYKEFKNGNLHVITGHTNTNVMDIHLIIIKKIEKN